MPKKNPPIKATPGRSKKKRFATIPLTQVQSRKNSGTARLAPRDLRLEGKARCKIAISPIPARSQPNAFEIGISD